MFSRRLYCNLCAKEFPENMFISVDKLYMCGYCYYGLKKSSELIFKIMEKNK